MLALIPLLPLLGFLVNASVGRRLSKAVSGGLASAVMVLSFGISASAVWSLVAMPAGARDISQRVFTWIAAGDFTLDLAFRLDPLSAVMILVITGIGSLIHIYSTAYMHDETDAEFARFFSYLNLFVFFMLLLVLGSNILVMFVGWEGVGLCSYLLIGYYYERKAASDAAKKAFIVNRVGDYAFIIGTLLTVVTFGTLDFQNIATQAAAMPPEATFGALTLITLLLFVGATGKSAQLPLYTWLPDAMEGPTPVSALIHAATMVTAGVYLIGRNAVLFEHAPITLGVVAVIGTATALFAGTIGLVQNDIKRVLAYSTVSQLGYMFMAMGVGAFGAGIFHLLTHAFFKALLFLGSGAVIHSLHGEQDLRYMGGLKKALPITYWTFLIGSLAIAGVPGLAGFFSKDEILFETFAHGRTWLWVVGSLTALLTATYMFRLVFLTFHGSSRARVAGHEAPAGGHADDAGHAHDTGHGHTPHLHDAPPAMALALIVLAVGSVLAGYVGVPHALGGHNALGTFLEQSFAPLPAAMPAGMVLGDCEAAPATADVPGAIGECGPGETADALPASLEHAVQGDRAPAHEAAADETALELTLMVVSSLIALIGIGLAAFLFLQRPAAADAIAARFPGLHRLLLNKYYVDEIYDAAIVQPIRAVSTEGLWRGFDVQIVDGAVNGAGYVVGGMSAVLRLLQSGSVKAYAASTFLGVVLILAYFTWR